MKNNHIIYVSLLLFFCTTALRVHPAVTRLTVYRRLYVRKLRVAHCIAVVNVGRLKLWSWVLSVNFWTVVVTVGRLPQLVVITADQIMVVNVRQSPKGFGAWLIFFWPRRGETYRFSTNLKNSLGPSETTETTHFDLWKNIGPSRTKLPCAS